TLVDTATDLLDGLNYCLDMAGIPHARPDEIRRYIGYGSRAMIERAFAAHGRPVTEHELDAQQALFLKHYAAGMPGRSKPFPGAVEALLRFRDAGFVAAVCTNKLEDLSRKLLDALDIGHLFEAVCGGDTFTHRKPDPRHLIDTIERAGGDPDRAVMIGDSRTDIDAAKAAGIPVVAVDFGYTDRPVREFGPSRIISHFDELTLELAENLVKSTSTRAAMSGSKRM